MSNFEDAMKAALRGPEKKKLKIFDHHFNVKPVEISRDTPSKGQITVIGQISHHLSLKPDDQMYYRFTKDVYTNKIIGDIKREINRGGYAGIAAPFIAAAGTYLTGHPIPPDKVEEIGRALGKVVDGSWESAADFIIGNVALRVYTPSH
jgi:hypothetical protein